MPWTVWNLLKLYNLTCMHDNTALCLPGLLIFQSTLTHCTETPVTFADYCRIFDSLNKVSLCQVAVNICDHTTTNQNVKSYVLYVRSLCQSCRPLSRQGRCPGCTTRRWIYLMENWLFSLLLLLWLLLIIRTFMLILNVFNVLFFCFLFLSVVSIM